VLFGTPDGEANVGTGRTSTEKFTRSSKKDVPTGRKPIGINSWGTWQEDSMPTLIKSGRGQVWKEDKVRYISPVEGERLMGFPDNWTQVSDWKGGPKSEYGARFAALGNSWSVPVARWVGERIQMVSEIS
jgi:site-specific DNA-cytosine methylase